MFYQYKNHSCPFGYQNWIGSIELRPNSNWTRNSIGPQFSFSVWLSLKFGYGNVILIQFRFLFGCKETFYLEMCPVRKEQAHLLLNLPHLYSTNAVVALRFGLAGLRRARNSPVHFLHSSASTWVARQHELPATQASMALAASKSNFALVDGTVPNGTHPWASWIVLVLVICLVRWDTQLGHCTLYL